MRQFWRKHALLMMAGAGIGPLSAHAKAQSSGPARWEGDPTERQEALAQLWDGATGTSAGNSGATFTAWLRAASGASLQRSRLLAGPAARQWTSIGPAGLYGGTGVYGSSPQLDGGRVASVAFHPNDPNILFIGTASGGLWRTDTEGTLWTPLETWRVCNSLVFGAVAVDPVTPSIVYAGTGDFTEGRSGQIGAGACGLLRSSDGGTSWARYPLPGSSGPDFQPFFARLAIDRVTAGSLTSTVLLAATNEGLYRSTDAGANWTRVQAGTFSDVVQDPGVPSTFFAALRGNGSTQAAALFRSTDRGVTWQLTQGFSGMVRLSLAVSSSRPRSVFIAAARNDRGFGGISRWDDDAGSLAALEARGIVAAQINGNNPNFGQQSDYNLSIAVDPRDANTLYVGGVEAFKSTNGGATFTHIARNIHVDWHALAVDPGNSRRILGGNDGGAFLSHDGGASFQSLNRGLATTLHYPGLALHPVDPTGVLTGMQDNGTVFGRNGMLQWSGIAGGDGGFAAIDASGASTYFYTSTQLGRITRIQSPLSVTQIATNITPDTTPSRAFIAPFVMDPLRPSRLYFGANRIYRTVDRGDTWTPISQQISATGSVITALTVAPGDSAVLLAGTVDGTVRYSRDFGTSFLAPASASFPARPVTDVAIDPANSQRMAVTFGGSGARNNVFVSTDGGRTWINRSTNLPDVTTMAVVFGPLPSLYVGNMFGVYRSDDDGASWIREDGVPFVRVTDLVYNSRTNRLVAATYGRGIWAYDLATAAPVLRGDTDGDGRITSNDATVIQNALLGMQLRTTDRLFPNGDTNCDGSVGILDAIQILRFVINQPNVSTCINTTR
jgi:photosystem II stability/assembly factor-like uncharacterized protein